MFLPSARNSSELLPSTAKDVANSTELVIDGEHILISGLSSIGHCVCQLVGGSIDGQWMSISHPVDSGSRGMSGGADQCIVYRVKLQVKNIGWSWRKYNKTYMCR